MYCYFPDGASSFADSVIAAAVVGMVFGILAALFGKRYSTFCWLSRGDGFQSGL